jgi:hypothetical protein
MTKIIAMVKNWFFCIPENNLDLPASGQNISLVCPERWGVIASRRAGTSGRTHRLRNTQMYRYGKLIQYR